MSLLLRFLFIFIPFPWQGDAGGGVRNADDIYVGGNKIDELLSNWSVVLEKMRFEQLEAEWCEESASKLTF